MKKLLLVALAAASIGVSASAETLRLAPGVPQAHPSYSHGYVPFVDYLAEESGGRLDATILGPEVVSLAQMKDALQTRVAQIGLILPLYFPADFPNIGLAAEIALVGQEPMAMAAALSEYIVSCAECQRELRKFDGCLPSLDDKTGALAGRPQRAAFAIRRRALVALGEKFRRCSGLAPGWRNV